MPDFRQTHPDGVILAVDQMRAYLQASLKRMWYPIGQTPVVRVSPRRDSIAFYGGLVVISGQQIALSLPGMSGESTVYFLKHVLASLPNRPILILWDRAPWHKVVARHQWGKFVKRQNERTKERIGDQIKANLSQPDRLKRGSSCQVAHSQ